MIPFAKKTFIDDSLSFKNLRVNHVNAITKEKKNDELPKSQCLGPIAPNV